jgi:2-polyprenyl-6-methoxyphenol hydroxylase-like FAD-dependent oxidoreductase
MSQKRSVAIVGAGQTGVSAAVGFLNAGFDVTLFSDRDRERLRNDGPATGTAVTFAVAQAAERELGLDDYLGRAPRVTGQSTQVFSGSGADREDGLDFDVEYDGVRAAGVDTRLKVDDRIAEFLSRGGRFVGSVITADSLDESRRHTTSRWWRRDVPDCPSCSRSITPARCTTSRSGACSC